jgi:short-subunit dehydrogenase
MIPGVDMLPLDVRGDDSVRACVEAVSSRAGHLDVLINNAGQELAGALEELSSEEARALFETNFFGVVRMVNAILPLMRRQRRGHIVNVSSLAGLTSIPFLGIYSASKFALEGYTEALRHEVKPFNIHVSLTEAAFLRTPMMDNRQVGAHRIGEYDRWRQRALDAIRAYEEKGPGRSWWPKRCSRSSPAIGRGYATGSGSKRSPSAACGACSPRGRTNRECGVPSRWTREPSGNGTRYTAVVASRERHGG